MSMPRFYAGLMLVSAVACLVPVLGPAASAEEPATMKIQQGADEAAIRATATAFASAFNKGDAQAIAALMTEDGTYINDAGQRYTGRAAIQQEYEKFFAQLPGAKIQVELKMVKVISPTSAMGEGTSSLMDGDAPSPVSSSFLAIYQKQGNKWLMLRVQDVQVEIESTKKHFPDLGKLVGSWTCQNGNTIVKTTCTMVADGKFVERAYSVSENGTVTQSGKQIIGWNPMEQQITSWLFDSTGGHDYGVWYPQGKNGWASQSNGAIADGTPTSAKNILTILDDNTMTWKSVDRTMGGQSLPDTEVLTLKRDSANK